MLADISKTNISCLHPKHDETSFIQELVAQFLVHGGYVETARAFANEVREESRDLRIGQDSPLKNYEAGEDIDGINRQSKGLLFVCFKCSLSLTMLRRNTFGDP